MMDYTGEKKKEERKKERDILKVVHSFNQNLFHWKTVSQRILSWTGSFDPGWESYVWIVEFFNFTALAVSK